jgi:hypothetical protein
MFAVIVPEAGVLGARERCFKKQFDRPCEPGLGAMKKSPPNWKAISEQ